MPINIRSIFRSRKASAEDAETRTVYIKDIQPHKYCTNEISTAKYSVISFLPKFLFEQFRRYANIFFLVVALMQQIPNVSPTGRFTTVVPLTIIIIVSALKELVEDFKRHVADRSVNNTTALVLREGFWIEMPWKHVKVGDVVKVCNSQGIPADLVLLASSEPLGMCYIETCNLDGETNLKLRLSLPETSDQITANLLMRSSYKIETAAPNRKLDEFIGVLFTPDGKSFPLKPINLLLRGACIKNTKWIFGAVVYTGKETKVMLNSSAAPLKQSTMDRRTNFYIMLLFVVLIFLTLVTCFANLIWTNYYAGTLWYIALDPLSFLYFVYMLLTAFIVYHTIIPISLQVTLEVVRFIQALFINWDLDMYDPDSDTPAMARTSNLNEELGQVRHIFSDKTGTLTRNIMEFKQCSIAGVAYGCTSTNGSALTDVQMLQHIDNQDSVMFEFFTFLAVCHTVVPEVTQVDIDNERLTYQASSPDEAALVEASRQLGYTFTARTPDSVTVTVRDVPYEYSVLHVLEFTSLRKRMGVIVRAPDGRILLMVKGSDSVIFDRLASDSKYKTETFHHLHDFATSGLRTLCIASAVITPQFYEKWKIDFEKASTAMDLREEKLEEVAEQIEKNLYLLGATAIEDKLQDGVPKTIASLMQADISVWVLTGDKQETAINIGYSCCLLNPDHLQLIINTTSLDHTRSQLALAIEQFGHDLGTQNEVALIVDGKTLEFALTCDCRKSFLDVAMSCEAVICCRVSPWQKAEVVRLVRASTKHVTLAIGDGANDVGMIQAAHVGVGISGMEGMQAACSSDYAIAQFRFLKKLLFVHGAWNYHRLTKVILYSFYKNVCMYLIQFWFAMVSGFSGQIVFERWCIAMYNVMFSAAPPFAMGLFDRSCSAANCMRFPQLYKDSQNSESFNHRVFLQWLLNSAFHSAVLFWLPLLAFSKDTMYANGQTGSLYLMGNAVYTYVVVTVCLKAGLEHTAWTWLSHLAIWGSVVLWFLFLFVYSHFYPTLPIAADMVGMDKATYGCSTFWLGLLLIPTVALTRDFAWKILKRTMCANLREQVMRLEQLDIDPQRFIASTIKTKFTDKSRLLRVFRRGRSRDILRTRRLSESDTPESGGGDLGFAFSQEEYGAISQADLIRRYNSKKRKPEGQ